MEGRDFSKYLLVIVAVVAVAGLLSTGSLDVTGFAAKKVPAKAPVAKAAAKAPPQPAKPTPCREGMIMNQIQCPQQAKFYQKMVCRNARIVPEPLINRTTLMPVSCAPEIIILPEPIDSAPVNSYVIRSFSVAPPIPLGQVDVRLSVHELGQEERERQFMIEETVPQGWQIVDAGTLTQQGNRLRIAVVEGLSGPVQGVYTYRVRAPEQSGQYLFNGTSLFENMERSDRIRGYRSIQVNR